MITPLKDFVTSARRTIDAIGAENCFIADCSAGMWFRKWGWKADGLDLIPKADTFVLNFYVWLPCMEFEELPEGMVPLVVRGLGLILGSDRSALQYPSAKRQLTAISEFKNHVSAGLTWLEKFDTPDKCLHYLKASAHDPNNNGARPGSVVYRLCEKYLSGVVNAVPSSPCCTVGQFTNGPTREFRKLFVL